MSNIDTESLLQPYAVGKRIRAARRSKGLSQKDLASIANVSQPTVANWEKGSHAPRHGALGRVAAALDSSPAWLLGDIGGAALPAITETITQGHHHVPLLAWPSSVEDLDTGHVSRYISVTVSAQRPIALICQGQSLFSDGATLICDRADTVEVKGCIYLTTTHGRITLESRGASAFGSGVKILGRAVLALREL